MGTSRLFVSFTFSVLLTASGCANLQGQDSIEVHTTGNPDAKEVLTLDPLADIFQFEGVIYKTGIDWVEELTVTKDEQVGEIKTRNTADTDFENDMSNKLPVGAEIFSIKEDEGLILLVESEGKLLKYYALVEG